MREEKAPDAAASWVASSFGYAPFNWTYSRALEPEERALIASLGIRPGMRVLDLGCGGAATTFYFADAVAPDGEVVGIDNDPGHIAYAEMQRARWGAAAAVVTFRGEDAQLLPPDLGRFDLIWCSHVVVFFPDPVAVLRTLTARHLANGGRIVIRGWMDGPEHHRDFVVWPLDREEGPPGLLERFWAAHSAAVNSSMERQLGSQVPSGALSVVGLLQEVGLPQVDLLPETVVRRGTSLTDWDARFLSARLRWMAGVADTLTALSPEDRKRLQQSCGAMASCLPLDFAYLSFGLTAVGSTATSARTSLIASAEHFLPSAEDRLPCAAYYIPYRVGPRLGLMDRVNAALRTVSLELSVWGRAIAAGGHPYIDIQGQVLTEEGRTSSRALWTQARSHLAPPSDSLEGEDWRCFMELTDPTHSRCLLHRHDFLLIRCGVFPVQQTPACVIGTTRLEPELEQRTARE